MVGEAVADGSFDLEASIRIAEENFSLAQKAAYKFFENSLVEISEQNRFYIASALGKLEVEDAKTVNFAELISEMDFVDLELTTDIQNIIEETEKIEKIEVLVSVIKIVEETEVEIDESLIDLDIFFTTESSATVDLEIITEFIESFDMEISVLDSVFGKIQTEVSAIAEIIESTPCSGVLATESDIGCICESPKEIF